MVHSWDFAHEVDASLIAFCLKYPLMRSINPTVERLDVGNRYVHGR
jgi:hypothetical protein